MARPYFRESRRQRNINHFDSFRGELRERLQHVALGPDLERAAEPAEAEDAFFPPTLLFFPPPLGGRVRVGGTAVDRRSIDPPP